MGTGAWNRGMDGVIMNVDMHGWLSEVGGASEILHRFYELRRQKVDVSKSIGRLTPHYEVGRLGL